MLRHGASGAMVLLVERAESSDADSRTVRLEASPDGKCVLLVDTDLRKPGIHREIRYEITAAELIAAIRSHGAEVPHESFGAPA